MSTTISAAQTGTGLTKTGWRAALSPVVIALGALLVLQLVLALVLGLGGRDMTPAGSQGPLLAFDPEKVTGIRIQAAEGEPVLVAKTESGWIIPVLGDLPAAESKVADLLSKLEGLDKGLPVATSEEALKRFKVADENFERKLSLESGDDKPAILYLGDSPGFRRLFVRTEGDSAVYDVELGLFDAPDKADDWSDRTLLHLDNEKIQRLTFPGVKLERRDGNWQLVDLAEGEEQDEQEIEDAVGQVANLDFLGVLAGDEKPEVDKKATPLEIEATLSSGETIQYSIAKLAAGNDYLLEVSNRPQRFRLASYAAEALMTGLNRASLLKKAEEAGVSPIEEPTPAETPKDRDLEPVAETATNLSDDAKEVTGTGSPEPEATTNVPAAASEPGTPDESGGQNKP